MAVSSSIYTDGEYLARTGTWHAEDSPWKADRIAELFERNSIKPETICEIGCGSGEILNRLSDSLKNVRAFQGYEISPQAIELCRPKAKPNLEFHLADLLVEPSEPFDVVMAIDVFEHVEDYLGFLKKLRAKGEHKVFHIPLDLSVQSVLRSAPILKSRAGVGHLHYFTKETALETLSYAGYEIVDWFYTGSAIDLPNRGWKANLMKWPRKALFRLNPDLTVRLLGGYSLLVLAK